MKRHLSIALLGLAGLLGSLGTAEACHKKKQACPPPVVVCEPVPVCAPQPVCPPARKKCCFKMPKIKMPKRGCHKKAVCAPAPVCETAWPAPQVMPSAQATPTAQG